MSRIISAFKQFFDDAGDPLVNGWLKFTISGTNNTDKDTFADVSEDIANANPLQLDAAGRCPNVFGSGSYRVTSFIDDTVLHQPGQQIQQFDPVGGSFGDAAFDDWNAESIYSSGDIVTASDDLYYRSLSNNNQGNDPTIDDTTWEQIEFVEYWNANRTYAQHNKVRTTVGIEYISLINSNTNNEPATNSDKWQAETLRTWTNTQDFAINELVRNIDGFLWFSLIADNTGNDPKLDDGTKWSPAGPNQSIAFTGGGILLANRINELQDGSTYTMPLANSVPAGAWVQVELPDEFSQSTPTVQRGGADTITDVNGPDTAVLFNTLTSIVVRFVSDGISDWRI